MKSITFKAGLLIFVSIIFAMVSFYGYQIMFTANLQVNKPDITLYITKDMDYKAVIDSMKSKRIIHDELSFQFLAKLMGYQDKVVKGRYVIPKNSPNFKILKMLVKGRQTPVKLAINNIRLKEDLAEKIRVKIELSKQEILDALTNDSTCIALGFTKETIMTMFIPNTYEVYWDITISDLMKKMKSEYEIFWTDERKSKAKAIGLSPTEVMIMASIVEAETLKNDEKPRIAGVYLNRLQKGQKLQADPTVKFALGDFEIKRILHGHLETDSPYNTYRYKGLPPGPINLPTISSIDGVLNFEKHDYFFFCADFDKPGYHAFATTFEEHLKYAKSYRDELDERNIR